jgi:hypothetical protein
VSFEPALKQDCIAWDGISSHRLHLPIVVVNVASAVVAANDLQVKDLPVNVLQVNGLQVNGLRQVRRQSRQEKGRPLEKGERKAHLVPNQDHVDPAVALAALVALVALAAGEHEPRVQATTEWS